MSKSKYHFFFFYKPNPELALYFNSCHACFRMYSDLSPSSTILIPGPYCISTLMLGLNLYFELHFQEFNALFYFQCLFHPAFPILHIFGDWSSVLESGTWQPADSLLSSCCPYGLLGSLKSPYSRRHSCLSLLCPFFRESSEWDFPSVDSLSGHHFVVSVSLQIYIVFHL